MTLRDFLQRRATRLDGSTFWQDSPLVHAARHGELLLMEGVHWVPADVLAGLSSMLVDRNITLPDNSRLVSHVQYDAIKTDFGLDDAQMTKEGIFRVHPAFRVVATATTEKKKSSNSIDWFTEEIGSMFSFIQVAEMSLEEERSILTELSNCPQDKMEQILQFSNKFRRLTLKKSETSHDHVLSNAISLSTRQLLRICKRASFPDSDLYHLIRGTLLAPFLPQLARAALDELLAECNIVSSKHKSAVIATDGDSVRFGDVAVEKYRIRDGDLEARALIPYSSSETSLDSRNSTFFDNNTHSDVMRDIALDFSLGEHLLIIGNQGVGKNKLVDRFLELLQYPREYIQLHRDTTVQSLLLQPVLENGKIIHRDSPLIKAVSNGRVLVVDEADKAPVYITSILKSLVEDGEMELGDGRRIRKRNADAPADPDVIELHPDFRMVVLANRPGYPFLGNDFFGSIGEVFGTYPVENPSFESEMALLSQLAPSVERKLLRRLVGAFNDLRKAFDNGLVSYPYSLRELINLVRHLERFPDQNIATVLRNVFDFDVHRTEMNQLLLETFQRHGIPLTHIGFEAVYQSTSEKLAIKYATKQPPPIDAPKHGKVDEKNEPHVGGNTWAGGTGGSNTAGLGGRGGPYRLDSGHEVHQLSDNLKNQVPKEILEAAKKMGESALAQRLKEIHMNPKEADLYTQLSKNVQLQVQQLRVILEGVDAKKKERVWIRNQTDGELDESKLFEGITGEHAIFKKRGHEDTQAGFHELPKRLKFVFDVSGSMYRFNGYDQRLTKSLETCLMVMQALQNLEHKYTYDIVGHSGDSDCIELVSAGKPPKNEKQMLQVLLYMNAHAQYCWSGDNTMRATRRAIDEVVKETADDYFVFVVSDANLRRYAISPKDFGNILEKDPKVSAVALFIGSLGDEARELTRQLPQGRSFFASNTQMIPSLMKDIFSAAIEK
ncbi:hypothetical protein HDU91_002000 [Kappamyces sp. JEL0680]|nr:hypothetical protein HDU91_002000 [Kappamyces sp. JEL0680]